jgi:NADH:ubiquinone oxidoreductase subunit 6 (subunit J)
LRRGVWFYLWLVGIVVGTLVIGQFVMLLVFVAAYLRIWGKEDWKTIVLYTIGAGIVLYVLFSLVVPVMWHESPFFELFD